MTDSIRLGTVRGIRIGMHWSVALVAWLLAWGLATRVLPGAAPGASSLEYWLGGIAAALLFFGSLLAHELAHAVFARRAGVRVEGITLWLLGGVAKLDGEAPTPDHELRIAASGPIASAGLGVLFGAAALGLGATGASRLAAEAAAYLSFVNFLLAAFNLLPGAPLDGGRIVRAVAWRTGRDRLRASLLAARMGRLIGVGLVVFGALELVVGADPAGIWTMVVGLFLSGAASAEAAGELTRDALAGVRVREVMTPDPTRVPSGITVDVLAAAVLVPDRRTAALVVEAGGTVIGVAGMAEVATLRGGARRDARVRDIAVPLDRLPVVGPDELLVEAVGSWRVAEGSGPGGGGRRGPARYLLVVEDGEVVGLVSQADLDRTIEARVLLAEGRNRSGGTLRDAEGPPA